MSRARVSVAIMTSGSKRILAATRNVQASLIEPRLWFH